MSIQQNIDYHAQSLADKALSAKDPRIINSILGSLTTAIQDGSVKPYVGIPLVQSINQHLQTVSQQASMLDALKQTPPVAPEQTIGAQTLQQTNTQPSLGIDTAESNLPTQMASGGIIAFDDGGEVESYASKGYVAPTEDDWIEQYRKTRQLGEANLMSKKYGQPTESVTQAGITTPYDAALEYYKGVRQDNPLMSKGLPELMSGINALKSRRDAWLAGSLDPYSQTSPVGSKPNMLGTQAPVIPTDATQPPKSPIVIHDDKEAKPSIDTTPTVDVSAKKIDALDELMASSKKDREDLKNLILGDDTERSKDKQIDLLTAIMGAGFKAASGTSPYAATNIAGGGEDLAKGIAGIQRTSREEKDKRINQLVSLGLKGRELDTELAKLGVTRDYYEMHKPLLEAQAKYYRDYKGKTGNAGLGSVSSATVQSELDRLEGYKANPKSAPFFARLPLDVQTAILKTDPKSGSYQRAIDVFNKEAEKYAQSRLGTMQFYGVKQRPSTTELP